MLDPRPARTDLTDRECARIIGGLLGSLSGIAFDAATVRRAVRFWADTDELWVMMEDQQQQLEQAGLSPKRQT
jgi:hypothetical protein